MSKPRIADEPLVESPKPNGAATDALAEQLEDLRKERDELVAKLEARDAERKVERGRIRSAMARSIAALTRVADEIVALEQEIAPVSGSIETARELLEQKQALLRAKLLERERIRGHQDKLERLYLGDQRQTPRNPGGKTVQAMLNANEDGLQEAVAALLSDE